MRQKFPPTAEHPREIKILSEAFACVVAGRTALYVSSPLTTGRRASEWHLRSERTAPTRSDADDFRRRVIEPNRQQAAAYVRDLRERTKRVVIDPTALEDMPRWTQADYQVFWGQVIQRYAEAVVFRNGWQYSSGCAYEFLVSHTSGGRLLREDLTPLTLEEGLSLIGRAIQEARMRGASGEFLQQVREALEEAATPALDP